MAKPFCLLATNKTEVGYPDRDDDVVLVSVLTGGRWSGGAQAVQANIRFAAKRLPHLLSTDPGGGPPYLLLRNVAPLSLLQANNDFVVLPQNLWAWEGPTSGAWEWWWRTRLFLASEVTLRRTRGVVRLSSRIPSRGKELGGILPNVLDEGFDIALANSSFIPSFADEIVCFASDVSYTNLAGLINAYAIYLRLGGRRRLHLVVHPIRGGVLENMTTSSACRVDFGFWDRAHVVSAMRSCYAVVFPSLVEASPMTLLEALAVDCRIVLSDIPGHRETARGALPEECYFALGSPDAVATALLHCESMEPMAADFQATARARTLAREKWADDLAVQLSKAFL